MFYKSWDDSSLSTVSELNTWKTTPIKVEHMYKLNSKGGKENMEYLYQVYVVDNKKNFIINGEVVVAKDEDDAKFDLQVTEKVRAKGLKLSDVTVIVKLLGNVKVEGEK